MMKLSARRFPARVTVLLMVIAALLATAGCGVNRGSQGAADFKAAMEAIAGVDKVTTGGTNDLPFAGAVSGTVILQADLSPDAVETVVHEVGKYLNDHSGAGLSFRDVSVAADDFTLAVAQSRETNTGIVGLYRKLRADPDIVGADLGISGPKGEGAFSLRSSVSDFLGAYRKAVELRDTHPVARTWSVTVTSTNAKVSLSEVDSRGVTGAVDAAVAAYQAALAVAPVTSATLDPASAALVIGSPALVVSAFDAATKSSPALTVRVTGGAITRSGAAGPAPTDALLADAVAHPGLVSLTLTEKSTWYELPLQTPELRAASVRDLTSRLLTIPQYTQLTQIGIRAGQETSRGDFFQVSAAPSQLADRVRIATAVAAYNPKFFDPTGSSQLFPQTGPGLLLRLPATLADATPDDLKALAKSLRPAVPAGLQVVVLSSSPPVGSAQNSPSAVIGGFTTGGQISVSHPQGGCGSRCPAIPQTVTTLAQALEDEWNSPG
ncbi:hypothetical protein [Psychromicrobium xiongbiense]|uniref:hypothetical protein n=1 Tax=Psychromicrobium xiongbiense TaxID=3051184 RepID=UPI002552977C|nr:hypothetical protein [Psychromicrobium sp. YIM S02556]